MSIFYGLVLKPCSKYVQVVSKPFHISNVALDDGDFAKLYLAVNGERFAVATLTKAMPQMPLDLNFRQGDQLTFQAMGNGSISLLGYLRFPQPADDDEYAYLGGDDTEDTVTDATSGSTWRSNAGEGYDAASVTDETTDIADSASDSDNNNDGDNEDESESEDGCATNTESEEVQRGVEDELAFGEDDDLYMDESLYDDYDEYADISDHNGYAVMYESHEEVFNSDGYQPSAKRYRIDKDLSAAIVETVQRDLCGGLPAVRIGSRRRQTWPCSRDPSVHEEPPNISHEHCPSPRMNS